MKATHFTSIICSIIIGFSIVVGCMQIPTNNANEIKHEDSEEIIIDYPLLNIEQAAKYLNLTKEQVNYIIQSEQKTLSTTGSFSGERFPYFKVNNEIYISKDQLIVWIKDVTMQKREYIEGQVIH